MAQYSYNGWLASQNPADFGGLDNSVVPGTNVKLAPGVRKGDVATVLHYVAEQLDKRVEQIEEYAPGDEWGYSYRKNANANNLSCHASGTAFDYNATQHPNGSKGTFTTKQVSEIRKILAEVSNVVTWGGDFPTKDEMHFEISKNSAAVTLVANKLRNPVSTSGVRALYLANPKMTGADVKALQAKLNKSYPAYSKLVTDGVFGTATDIVVREFQKRAGLTVDGAVGPATRAKLGL